MDSDRLPWHLVMRSVEEATLLWDFSHFDCVEFGIWLGTSPFDDSCFGVRIQVNKCSPQYLKPLRRLCGARA
eukprot:1259962-Rhodomonas_salina.3